MPDLASFNAEPPDRARELLRACNAAPRFAEDVAAGRPYYTVAALIARAEQVSRGLTWLEVGAALVAHPRIGDAVHGSGAEAESSRREQSAMADADSADRAALAADNLAYEQRFHHVFLIRAAGRSPAEMLTELRRRMLNDVDTERAEVTEQLAQITGLRVRGLASP